MKGRNDGLLNYYLGLIEKKKYGYPLFNILNTIKAIKDGDISGHIFNGIDFGQYRLNDINFSDSKFNGCTFHNENFVSGHNKSVISVCVSSDCRYIITGSADKTAVIWDADTCHQKHRLKGHNNTVTAVAFAADGKYAVTGSEDCTVRVWDAETGKELEDYRKKSDSHIISLVITTDGKIAVNTGKKEIILYELKKQEPKMKLVFNDCTITCFSVTKEHIVAATRKELIVKCYNSGRTRTVPYKGVVCMSLSSDGKYVFAGTNSGEILKIDPSAEDIIAYIKNTSDQKITCIFSEGKYLAAGLSGGSVIIADDSEIRYEKNFGTVYSVFLTEKKCIVINGKATASVWDYHNNNVSTLEGRIKIIKKIYASGKYFSAVTEKGDFVVRNIETGKEECRFKNEKDLKYYIYGSDDETEKVFPESINLENPSTWTVTDSYILAGYYNGIVKIFDKKGNMYREYLIYNDVNFSRCIFDNCIKESEADRILSCFK